MLLAQQDFVIHQLQDARDVVVNRAVLPEVVFYGKMVTLPPALALVGPQ
jgi:hypothetical protein